MTHSTFLVSGVGQKLDHPAPAGDLYTSQWFRLARRHVGGADWRILSAEHGLIHPDEHLAPYEKTLNVMPKADRLIWAQRVFGALCAQYDLGHHFTVLAGRRYREFLLPQLTDAGFTHDVPMQGLGIGQQLSWLTSQQGART